MRLSASFSGRSTRYYVFSDVMRFKACVSSRIYSSKKKKNVLFKSMKILDKTLRLQVIQEIKGQAI